MDIEETKAYELKNGTWTITVFYEGMIVHHCLSIYFSNFKQPSFWQKFLGLLYLCFALFSLIYDSHNNPLSNGSEMTIQLKILATIAAFMSWVHFIKGA